VLDQPRKHLVGQVAAVGELDDGRAGLRTGLHDVNGGVEVGVVEGGHHPHLDDGVEYLQTGEASHVYYSL